MGFNQKVLQYESGSERLLSMYLFAFYIGVYCYDGFRVFHID